MMRLSQVGLATAILLSALDAAAHHSAAVAYLVDKEITVTGVIAEVKWENPHTWIYMDAKSDTGAPAKWSFETTVPYQLYRRGVTPAVLKPGMEVTVTAHPARDASRNAGELITLITGEGKTLIGRPGRGN
jgi:hypothetical protein